MGSIEHLAVRDYIIKQCEVLGLHPEIHQTNSVRVFGGHAVAGHVQNIIGRIPGRRGDRAVLLMSHYDSDTNSPGAGDDAAGVAAMLESAHILLKGKQLENDILFLFTDGEEHGLLGANAFARERLEYMKKIGLVINLEGRGNDGSSIMFETSLNNGWLIGEYAKAAAYPIANSLNFEIYKRLPNDTDYTIFKERGIAGFNHAFIEGFVNYHSMGDTPENLNPNSLQHHGENVVSLARHFGNVDLSHTPTSDATYFNVIGTWLVHYPGALNLYLVIVSVLLTIVLIAYAHKQQVATLKKILLGFMAFLAITALSFFVVRYFVKVVSLLDPLLINFNSRNGYNSSYYFVSIVFLCLAAFAPAMLWLGRKINAYSFSLGIICMLNLMLVVIYVFAYTAVYLVFFPLFFLSISQAVLILKKKNIRDPAAATLLIMMGGSIPSVILLSPTIYFLFVAFGLSDSVAFVVIVIAIIVGPTYPLLQAAFKRPSWILGGTLAACILLAAIANYSFSFSKEKPLYTNVRYFADLDESKAHWVTEAIDIGNNKLFPNPVFVEGIGYLNEAPLQRLPSPAIHILDDTLANGVRTVTLHCSNPRKSSSITLVFAQSSNVKRITMAGQAIVPSDSAPSLNVLDYYAFPEEGLSLKFELAPGMLEFYTLDRTIGLTGIAHRDVYPEHVLPGPSANSNIVVVKKYFKM